MQHAPETTGSSAAPGHALVETAQAAGRIAVLLLFTGLFAAAWNGDGTSPAAHAVVRAQDRRTHAPALAGDERRSDGAQIRCAVRICGQPDGRRDRRVSALLGNGVMASTRAVDVREQFVGAPALLGGTLRAETAVLTARPEVEDAAR
jgi:hypothetical protein